MNNRTEVAHLILPSIFFTCILILLRVVRSLGVLMCFSLQVFKVHYLFKLLPMAEDSSLLWNFP
ncbi:hypothetical protein DM02DRAFT_180589 [Periconia macrospinosa]|uniref:Uncharacterized protein n=1 Tax=Periconia macrospinosa TaxID=97972 RepID=A0A2V1DCE7_9PLEO|nr:hypothetical protein DM02DRAFT_180589 [Periconia macrospinosa]